MPAPKDPVKKHIGVYERRRGTAIVDTPFGIIVVKGNNSQSKFILPGGQPEGRESRLEASVRELREETGLIARSVLFMFEYKKSKIFLINAIGLPKPLQEIATIGYYISPITTINVTYDTREIIERYLKMRYG
jgi:8-oxo-dGTP pyrophosphatase MutT (NUDIX family)